MTANCNFWEVEITWRGGHWNWQSLGQWGYSIYKENKMHKCCARTLSVQESHCYIDCYFTQDSF
jgi:hypothetical protein